MRIFVDTSAFIALLNPQDTHHQLALERSPFYFDCFMYTSQAVISEICTIGAMRYDKAKTISFINSLFNNEELTIISETPELIDETWRIFQKVKKKDVSWVDCYSIAIMKKHLISKIFTFDKHFDKLITQFIE